MQGGGVNLCPIHLFDRDYPSAPTCARSWPSRAAALKDGALQRHRRLVLDRREHGGMINAQGGEENTRDDSRSLNSHSNWFRAKCGNNKNHPQIPLKTQKNGIGHQTGRAGPTTTPSLQSLNSFFTSQLSQATTDSRAPMHKEQDFLKTILPLTSAPSL